MYLGSLGSLLNGSSTTTSISGRRSTRARTCKEEDHQGQQPDSDYGCCRGMQDSSTFLALTHCYRFATSSVSHDEGASDVWVHHIEQQGQFHVLLTLNLGEGKARLFRPHFATCNSSTCCITSSWDNTQLTPLACPSLWVQMGMSPHLHGGLHDIFRS